MLHPACPYHTSHKAGTSCLLATETLSALDGVHILLEPDIPELSEQRPKSHRLQRCREHSLPFFVLISVAQQMFRASVPFTGRLSTLPLPTLLTGRKWSQEGPAIHVPSPLHPSWVHDTAVQ